MSMEAPFGTKRTVRKMAPARLQLMISPEAAMEKR
jgi:hypothetical protein